MYFNSKNHLNCFTIFPRVADQDEMNLAD